MDWFSRFVISWELSNTMETGFCLTALEAAFHLGQPEMWNSSPQHSPRKRLAVSRDCRSTVEAKPFWSALYQPLTFVDAEN